jgi:hypothetical protein
LPINMGGSPSTWSAWFDAVPDPPALGFEFDRSHRQWQRIDPARTTFSDLGLVILVTDRHTAPALLTSLRGSIDCALPDEMLASVREGESRTLAVRREAGAGKTALLESAARIGERILGAV